MLMGAKVPTCAHQALQAVADGMCVVVGLQSTGEANTAAVREQEGYMQAWRSGAHRVCGSDLQCVHPCPQAPHCVQPLRPSAYLLAHSLPCHLLHPLIPWQARGTEGDELEDLVSAPKMVLTTFVRNWFPTRGLGMSSELSHHSLDQLEVQVRGQGAVGCHNVWGGGQEGAPGAQCKRRLTAPGDLWWGGCRGMRPPIYSPAHLPLTLSTLARAPLSSSQACNLPHPSQPPTISPAPCP